MKRDPLGWLAVAASIAVTAQGEWALAVACGYHPVVAGALPVAIDAYAIRSLRAGREVLPAVLAMVATNSAAHLLRGGMLTVSPWLVVAVSAIAPLVLWRMHVLQHQTAHADVLPVDNSSAGVAELVEGPVYPEPVPTPPAVEAERPVLDFLPLPQWAPAVVEEAARPRPVLAAEQPRTRTEVRAEYVPEDDRETGTEEGDAELIARGRAEFADRLTEDKVPPIREIRSALGVGQARAQRVQDALRRDVEQGVRA